MRREGRGLCVAALWRPTKESRRGASGSGGGHLKDTTSSRAGQGPTGRARPSPAQRAQLWRIATALEGNASGGTARQR